MVVLWVLAGVVVLFGVVVFFGAPYIPSHKAQVRRAFTELYPLSESDVVVDLGSGDGVVLQVALEQGALRAIGYELNPLLVGISKLRLRNKPIEVHVADMWSVQPPDGVTVLYAFSVGRDMERLEQLAQRWATHTGVPLSVIVYGHLLRHAKPASTVGAHHLYTFSPLQEKKAQV